MFWHHVEFAEHEWSVSAKLFAGLVFNPFSVVNEREDSLFLWFLHRVTGNPSLHPQCWSAIPEYVGELGRNDWRLHVDNWRIAVECKFGDGIDPHEDCLKYLQDLQGNRRRVVVVATDSEFSALTSDCLKNSFHGIPTLKNFMAREDIALLTWAELIEEICSRLPEDASQTVREWASTAERADTKLIPDKRMSGKVYAECIISGKEARIPITHSKDARSMRRPTSDLSSVCKKRKAPDWVREYLEAVNDECGKAGLIFESKCSGWINIRRKRDSHSVTLFPWHEGVAILITHPPDPEKAAKAGFRSLAQLVVSEEVPKKKQWFPKVRTQGFEMTAPDQLSRDAFVTKTLCAVDTL